MQEPTLDLEKEAYANGFNLIAGIDEAGRGPLAGPVVVASVILGNNWNEKIPVNDSKKISNRKREHLFDLITNEALTFKIVYIPPNVIDRMNILQATLLGMYKCISQISPSPDYVLVDGNHYPNIKIKGKAVIKGDCLSKSIAAASILAKVTRDRFMIDSAKHFPEWSFEKHKGYPTDLHRKLIAKYGLSNLHRKSFKVKPLQMDLIQKVN